MPAAFFLGTHQTGWLACAGVPLFVSDTRLRERVGLPRAAAPWACDSGGFTQLQKHGAWTIEPADYIARVRRYRDEIGRLEWAAPQDWMCEPAIIDGGWHGGQYFAGTHLPVAEHQHRTVANFLHLRETAPDLPFIPVLQGFALDDYRRCADLYDAAGIDLALEPIVGLGSVCRREATREIFEIVAALHACGLTRLHGFGVKSAGLDLYGGLLASADSLAWSFDARRYRRPSPWCTDHCRAKNCASCLSYALAWRARTILPRLAARHEGPPMTHLARIPAAAAGIEIPQGARIPLGAPAEWLTAAVEAGWQCQCVTPGKGRAKEACSRSHFDEQDHRCRHSATGECAMRLILATDAAGVLRLMCEPCAAGHAATLVRQHAAEPGPDPADLGQDALFAL